MFNFFKKKKRYRSENPLSKIAVPVSEEEAALYRRPVPQNLEQEFMSVYMQTRSAPLGDYENAWNWMLGKLRYFKAQGLEQNKLQMLANNLMVYMNVVYRDRIGEFLEVMPPRVILNCVRGLMESGNHRAAKAVAEPLWAYSSAHMETLDLDKQDIILLAMAVSAK